MYISTEINSFRKVGDNRKILTMLKEAGFTAYDFSMFYNSLAEREILNYDDYAERAKDFRRFADRLGLPCNQAHAPFPSATNDEYPRFGMSTEEYNSFAREKICRAIEVAGILGAKIIVVHPWNFYAPQENAQLYQTFVETARKAGVKIAVENMWNWADGAATASAAACSHHEDFKAHLALLDKEDFVACLDIGHAEMAGLETSAVEMIHSLGERLACLHIHDNDLVRDSHQLPYTSRIDFSAVLVALKEVGYQGDITMEADSYAPKFPLELYPQAMRLMAEVGEYMRLRLQEK